MVDRASMCLAYCGPGERIVQVRCMNHALRGGPLRRAVPAGLADYSDGGVGGSSFHAPRVLRSGRRDRAGAVHAKSLRPPPTIGKPDMWPMVEIFNQPRFHRIVPHVFPFVLKICLVANAVIKIVPLPSDARVSGKIAFPILNDISHGIREVPRKGCQQMQVVRHQYQHDRPPAL